jgi:hypothetical protein
VATVTTSPRPADHVDQGGHPPVTTAAEGQGRYLDTVVALALIGIVTFHQFGWHWLPLAVPSMGVLFAVAGSRVAGGFDPGARQLLDGRLRQIASAAAPGMEDLAARRPVRIIPWPRTPGHPNRTSEVAAGSWLARLPLRNRPLLLTCTAIVAKPSIRTATGPSRQCTRDRRRPSLTSCRRRPKDPLVAAQQRPGRRLTRGFLPRTAAASRSNSRGQPAVPCPPPPGVPYGPVARVGPPAALRPPPLPPVRPPRAQRPARRRRLRLCLRRCRCRRPPRLHCPPVASGPIRLGPRGHTTAHAVITASGPVEGVGHVDGGPGNAPPAAVRCEISGEAPYTGPTEGRFADKRTRGVR